VLSFRFDAAAFGLNSAVFHAHNVLLHGVNSVLVGLLARKLGLSQLASILAACIFSLHPVQTESVASVVGRADLLAAALLLLSQLLALVWRPADGPGWLLRAGSLTLLCIGACLCKETAIAAFPALALLEASRLAYVTEEAEFGAPGPDLEPERSTAEMVAIRRASKQQLTKSKAVPPSQAPATIPRDSGDRVPTQPVKLSTGLQAALWRPAVFLGGGVVFLAWRVQLSFGWLSSQGFSLLDNSFALEPSALARWLTVLHSHVLYALLLLWPFGRLSALHGYGEVPHIGSLSDARLLLVVGIYAAAAAFIWRLLPSLRSSVFAGELGQSPASPADRRSLRRLYISVGLALLPFVPASNVLVWVGAELGERFLYLPMVGLSILAADAIVCCGSDQAVSPDAPPQNTHATSALPADNKPGSSAAAGENDDGVAEADSSTAASASNKRLVREHDSSATAPGAGLQRPATVMGGVRAGACVGLLVLYAVASRARSLDYRSERALFSSAAAVAPGGVKPLLHLGESLLQSPPPGDDAGWSGAQLLRARSTGSGAGGDQSPGRLHDWAVAKVAVEACVAAFPTMPACWTSLGLLALREREFPLNHSVWKVPTGAAAAVGSGPAAGGLLQELADAAHSAIEPLTTAFRRALAFDSAAALHEPADVLPLLPRPRPRRFNPRGTVGDERALECLWKAMEVSTAGAAAGLGGSSDGRLPAPCEALVGIADVYLRIAADARSGGGGLPEWAVGAGGPLQGQLLEALASQRVPPHAVPLRLVDMVLEGPVRADCGSTAAAVRDVSDPFRRGRSRLLSAAAARRNARLAGVDMPVPLSHVGVSRAALQLRRARALLLAGEVPATLATLRALPILLTGDASATFQLVRTASLLRVRPPTPRGSAAEPPQQSSGDESEDGSPTSLTLVVAVGAPRPAEVRPWSAWEAEGMPAELGDTLDLLALRPDHDEGYEHSSGAARKGGQWTSERSDGSEALAWRLEVARAPAPVRRLLREAAGVAQAAVADMQASLQRRRAVAAPAIDGPHASVHEVSQAVRTVCHVLAWEQPPAAASTASGLEAAPDPLLGCSSALQRRTDALTRFMDDVGE
jgi:hypothetical protein